MKTTNSEKDLVRIIGNTNVTQVSLDTLSKPSSSYHIGAKTDIPEDLREKVSENKPFDGMNILNIDGGISLEEFKTLTKGVIKRDFYLLEEMGISLDDPLSEKSKEKFNKSVEIYRESNMRGQVASLQNEYASLLALKNIFSFNEKIVADEKFENKHLFFLQSVYEVCQTLKGEGKANVLNSLAKICEWNSLRGKNHVPAAVPVKFLPELLMSAPVWFSKSKNGNVPAARFMSSLLPSNEFALLYQLYNYRIRGLERFEGVDIMPAHLAENMNDLLDMFDCVVVATPYHDLASREWGDPRWFRNLDPFFIGLNKGSSHFVLVERWSGTGLFPLMTDMIADTVNHIKLNLESFKNINADSEWFLPVSKDSRSQWETHPASKVNLPDFTKNLVEHFDKGTLFPFLRGEVQSA